MTGSGHRAGGAGSVTILLYSRGMTRTEPYMRKLYGTSAIGRAFRSCLRHIQSTATGVECGSHAEFDHLVGVGEIGKSFFFGRD